MKLRWMFAVFAILCASVTAFAQSVFIEEEPPAVAEAPQAQEAESPPAVAISGQFQGAPSPQQMAPQESAPSAAAMSFSSCDTEMLDTSELLDPSGVPVVRKAFRPLTLHTERVLLEIDGANDDTPRAPKGLPERWHASTVTTDTILWQSAATGQKTTYRVLKFSPPLTSCDLLAGIDAWIQYQKSETKAEIDRPFGRMRLVFERGGKLEGLDDTVTVWLRNGAHPDVGASLLPKLMESGLDADKLNNNDSFRIDPATGDLRLTIKADISAGTSPVRLALKLADMSAWVSRVDLHFFPLESAVRTQTRLERMRLDGSSYRFPDAETPLGVPYEKGWMWVAEFDLLKDGANSKPFFTMLSTPLEFANGLKENVIAEKGTAEVILREPGCIQERVPASSRVNRIRVVCRFTIPDAGDYSIRPISFRLENAKTGAPLPMATERTVKFKVAEFPHDGTIPKVPDPKKIFIPPKPKPVAVAAPPAPSGIGAKAATVIEKTADVSMAWVSKQVGYIGECASRGSACPRGLLHAYPWYGVLAVAAFLALLVWILYRYGVRPVLRRFWRLAKAVIASIGPAFHGARDVAWTIPRIARQNPEKALKMVLERASGRALGASSAESIAKQFGVELPLTADELAVRVAGKRKIFEQPLMQAILALAVEEWMRSGTENEELLGAADYFRRRMDAWSLLSWYRAIRKELLPREKKS
ncbi:MAG: hypothetical protein HYT22_00080 [Candidatus Niyogibacteria bacterium]|nr:hypothetical protein [Candidatus Niyogibacteria bacterium]